MMLTREQLLSLADLKLGEFMDELNDESLDKYCGMLSDFVEDFPGIEADLKKEVIVGDSESVRYALSELSEVLANIHAEELVRECERLRQAALTAEPAALEAELMAFISAAATLSVDIQMEQHKNLGPGERPKTRGLRALAGDADGTGERQKSILAVDDIPVTLTLLKAALADSGYRFGGVTSGAAALDYITKFTPDLFILDIEMPNMNGFELAAKIREAGQRAPIVFLTGNTTREYLVRAIKIGAVDFVVKPVNADTVLGKVNKILGN